MSGRQFSRRRVLTYAGAIGLASVAGVGSVSADGHRSFAVIRVAHFSPDAPNVDVYVNGHLAFEDAPFGAITDYTSVRPGTYTVTITAAGDPDTVAFEADLDLAEGVYTITATGELTEETFEPLILQDGSRRAAAGHTKVRLVHASPDAPAVDVTVGDGETTLFDGVSYGDVTDYITVPGGRYELEVRADGNEDAGPVATLETPLNNTRVYTVFAGGYLTPDDEPANTPFVIEVERENATPRRGQGGGAAESPAAARLRVVHASPDAPNVDVFVDGDRVLTDVPFGTISEYLSLRPGRHEVTITAAGDPSTVAFDGAVNLRPDTDYTVAATGELTEETFAPLVLEDDNSDVESGQARVRVVHASPDAPAVDVTVGDGATTLVDDLPFGEATEFLTVPAGDYELEIRPADGSEPVAEIPATFEEGVVYTAFAAGYLTPDDEPTDEAFTLLVGTGS